MKKNFALLIVDVQTNLILAQPYRKEELICKIQQLLKVGRSHSTDIIYVRHDDGKGSELEKGTLGWQIYSEIAPAADEQIIDKNYNSAFKDTSLQVYLQSRAITDLIIVGLQTEYCIDATIKAAFELGYSIHIPRQMTTTFDNDYLSAHDLIDYFETKIWDKRYASVCSFEEVLEYL